MDQTGSIKGIDAKKNKIKARSRGGDGNKGSNREKENLSQRNTHHKPEHNMLLSYLLSEVAPTMKQLSKNKPAAITWVKPVFFIPLKMQNSKQRQISKQQRVHIAISQSYAVTSIKKHQKHRPVTETRFYQTQRSNLKAKKQLDLISSTKFKCKTDQK